MKADNTLLPPSSNMVSSLIVSPYLSNPILILLFSIQSFLISFSPVFINETFHIFGLSFNSRLLSLLLIIGLSAFLHILLNIPFSPIYLTSVLSVVPHSGMYGFIPSTNSS